MESLILTITVSILVFLFYRIYNSSYRGPFLNSLWSEKEWKNKTVMVIIPHQDDEINLAGATIKNLTDNHIHVIEIGRAHV